MKQSFQKSEPAAWFWLGPLLIMAIISIYFLLRFDGYWAEADSAGFTRYIRDFADKQNVLRNPDMSDVYPNGYAYQAISAFVVSVTGLEVNTLQQWIYPLVSTIVALSAWIAYRELTGSNLGATLATLLLLMQPEFLFVILRSSHEKFTRMLMLICLFLLFRSISHESSPKKVPIYIGLLYFAIFACITSNFILASSFIFAFLLVYLLGWIVERLKPHLKVWNHGLATNLGQIIPVCLALVYIFAFHIYPPARHNLRVVQNTWDLINELFLNVQTADVFVAYDYTIFGWLNLPTYFLLSLANWIVLAVSLAIWLHQSWGWIRHSEAPKSQMAWLLWLFYAAFAIQEVMAAVSDASGALSSNLQLRLFPSFSMIAVAMVGSAWAEWKPVRFRRVISLGLSGALFSLSIASVMKATNEPLFSNKWNFYHPDELLALQWADAHLNNAEVWTEFDERLTTSYFTAIGDPNNHFTFRLTSNTRDLLLSTIIDLRSSRIHQPIPVPPDALQVYDNGTGQLYHLRPRTPYQP